jgi:hypothetical protein
MIDGYETKEMKPTQMEAPKPSGMQKPEAMEDGIIVERDGMWFFKWKGGECGYMTKQLAEAGLGKVSGNS